MILIHLILSEILPLKSMARYQVHQANQAY